MKEVLAEIEELKKRLAALEHRVARGERETDAAARRTLDQVRAEVKSITGSVEAHLDVAICAALAPYLEKLQHVESVTALATRLPEIIALLERTERELIERRTRADLEAEAQKRADAEAELELAREEGKRTHRRALWAVLGTIAVALIGACGATVATQLRGPVVEPKK